MEKLNINQLIRKIGLSFFALFLTITFAACSNQNAILTKIITHKQKKQIIKIKKKIAKKQKKVLTKIVKIKKILTNKYQIKQITKKILIAVEMKKEKSSLQLTM